MARTRGASNTMVARNTQEVRSMEAARNTRAAARNTRAADSDIRAARNTEAETARTQGESSSSNRQTFFAP